MNLLVDLGFLKHWLEVEVLRVLGHPLDFSAQQWRRGEATRRNWFVAIPKNSVHLGLRTWLTHGDTALVANAGVRPVIGRQWTLADIRGQG